VCFLDDVSGRIVRGAQFNYSYGCFRNEASLAVSIALDLYDIGDLTEEELERVNNSNIQPDEALASIIRDKPLAICERFVSRMNEYDKGSVWFLIDYKGDEGMNLLQVFFTVSVCFYLTVLYLAWASGEGQSKWSCTP
jgi:hypothetical protein